MPVRYRPTAILRLIRRHFRRPWLKYGIPWTGAVLVGLAAVYFAEWANDALALFLRWINGRIWLSLLITPTLTAAAAWMTRRWFSGSEGSGIPQVIAALHGPTDTTRNKRLFGLRIIFGKLSLGLMGMAAGLTLGREGPTVHVGASIMYELRRFYPRASLRMERMLLLAGSAAGLSGAFNTPLAGILFAIEELTRKFEVRTNGVLITSIVFSGLVSLALAGNYLYFGQIATPDLFPLSFAIPVIISAILCGLAGAAFNLTLLHQSRWIPARLFPWRARSPLVWGAAMGLLVAIIGIATSGQTWGSGYEQARHLLVNHGEQVSWSYPIMKWLSMVLSYIAGLPGGLFSPSLSIGAGFGHWVSEWFSQYPPSALVAICMVGYMAAVTQSPLTSFVIVMEMINGGGLVIPLMATALMSSRIAGVFTPPLYEALAKKFYFGG
ncbi:MAG: chloride channel protein [Ferrovum sp.]|jgi:H+/Cl- antiporter ClcA|nr:chloride channel protein [Ferrovum sp.]NDU86845.1 chloride channel protein [Ferrovum sp.]